jgi:hypothetical protein
MWQISLVVVVNRHGDGAEPKHDYPLGHACFGEHVPESVLTKLARGLIGLARRAANSTTTLLRATTTHATYELRNRQTCSLGLVFARLLS